VARGRALALGVFVLAAIVLVAHAWQYRGFFIDDGFLSLRYAHRLAAGRGLTFTDGERVEGYSNLLWVLACALGMRLGLAGVIAARVVGFAAAFAAIGAAVAVGRVGGGTDDARPWRWLLPSLYGALLLALSMPIAAWAVGGLEGTLVAALLGWGLVGTLPLLDRESVTLAEAARPGLPLALLCWTRPDGALLVAAIGFGFLLARGLSSRALGIVLRIALLPVCAVAVQLAFRVGYYGEWVPNTAVVKLHLGVGRLRQGWRYLSFGALNLAGPLLVALGAFLVGERRRVVLYVSALVVWTTYVLVIGGDWMPAHRLLVPDFVLLALLGAELFRAWAARGGDWLIRGGILAIGMLAFFGVTQANDSEAPGSKHAWVWDSRVVGETLARAFVDEQPLAALDSAGALAFYSDLPALDLMGLCDAHIARSPAPDFGRGIQGHEHGDGKYALDRAPDLAIFCGPEGGATACYQSGMQMQRDPRWREWTLVGVEATQPHPAHPVRSLVWFRQSGRAVRMARPGHVRLAAWTIADGQRLWARPDPDGQLAIELPPHTPAIYRLPLDGGRWTLAAAAPSLTIVDANGRTVAAGAPPLSFALEAAATIELRVEAGASPLHLRAFDFTAAGAPASPPR
jgi:hypothetical protein